MKKGENRTPLLCRKQKKGEKKKIHYFLQASKGCGIGLKWSSEWHKTGLPFGGKRTLFTLRNGKSEKLVGENKP